MINTVIFDIGNVLVDFRWREFIAGFGYDKAMQDRIARASVLSPAWNEYDLGVLTGDEVLLRFVKNDPEIEEELKRTYRSLDGLLKMKDYAIPWIKELKEKGLRVLYLSNFSEKADKECDGELEFLPYTDGGILSYKVKLTKPDLRIYELLTERYALKPDECFFLDDTPANVEAARVHGYNAEVFTDYESARALLSQASRT